MKMARIIDCYYAHALDLDAEQKHFSMTSFATRIAKAN